jgi:hypothetical protein
MRRRQPRDTGADHGDTLCRKLKNVQGNASWGGWALIRRCGRAAAQETRAVG